MGMGVNFQKSTRENQEKLTTALHYLQTRASQEPEGVISASSIGVARHLDDLRCAFAPSRWESFRKYDPFRFYCQLPIALFSHLKDKDIKRRKQLNCKRSAPSAR